MNGLLVLGTDTGVGKTACACALLRLAHRRGLRVVPFKPIETGVPDVPDATVEPTDSEQLAAASRLPGLAATDVAPYRFAPPVAPSVAARLAGVAIEPERLLRAARALVADHHADAVLVEAAGGVLSPLAAGWPAIELANLFDIAILLVAANRLGTINHTALAVAEIRRRALPLAGVILVDTTAARAPDAPHNAAEIAALTGLVPLGTLAHCPAEPGRDRADAFADALAAGVDVAPLFARLAGQR